MPCDTPPPPADLEDMDDVIEEDVDDLVYEFVEESDLVDYTADDAIVTFTGHKDAVFCCNYDKTGQYAVSGGQDDKAFVWETTTGITKFECPGHLDSVVLASFSPDSAYIATGDMLGLVQAWDANTGEKVWHFDATEIIWMEWLHNSNNLIAGTLDGSCWKWFIPDDQMSVFQSCGVSTSAGSVSFNDETVAVGYCGGLVKFWNINDASVVGSISGSVGHQMSVTTIRYHPNNNLVLTGSEDGTAKLIKTSNYKVLWSINCCDAANHNHDGLSVEGVGFFPSQSLLATGTSCGLLSIWDIPTQTKRSTSEFDAAVVKLICDDISPVVYVATARGAIESYDMRSGNVVKTWKGHQAGILDINLSPDRTKILSASDDNTCKIFER